MHILLFQIMFPEFFSCMWCGINNVTHVMLLTVHLPATTVVSEKQSQAGHECRPLWYIHSFTHSFSCSHSFVMSCCSCGPGVCVVDSGNRFSSRCDTRVISERVHFASHSTRLVWFACFCAFSVFFFYLCFSYVSIFTTVSRFYLLFYYLFIFIISFLSVSFHSSSKAAIFSINSIRISSGNIYTAWENIR